jgi:acetyltransferase
MRLENLHRMFHPQRLAVVGASDRPGSIGEALMRNLTAGGYAGQLYPVNPNHSSVAGRPAFGRIGQLPEPADLALIALSIDKVPEIIRDCARNGVGAAVVISAGGKETGQPGRRIEKEIAAAAEGSDLRIVGPNCVGIICQSARMNASFIADMPLAGKMAFVSQSGAVCGAVLDLSLKERIGFSYFVSLGSMLDVDFSDMIDYLGGEADVSSIVMYVENLTRFRNFMSAARAVSRVKPIIVLKSGRTPAGARAAASHTGAMVGEDAVYDAAFKRAGIMRVDTFEALFDCAELLAKQPKPVGRGLAIITNAGGPGVMAADALSQTGFDPVRLLPETVAALDRVLPPNWSRSNPIDMLGEASTETYRQTVETCFKASEINGLLVMMVPQAITDCAEVAGALVPCLTERNIPVITSWIGGLRVEPAREIFNRAGVPTFDSPERAVRAFTSLWRYGKTLEMLREIPARLPRDPQYDSDRARRIVRENLSKSPGQLTETEAKALLSAYGIPVNPTEAAFSEEEAVAKAETVGYPVAVKLHCRDVVHKTEADGVSLNLRDADQVRGAFRRMLHGAATRTLSGSAVGVSVQAMVTGATSELILGVKKDPDFGPVILFGMGGVMAELLQDRALALPPLNRLLARRLMEETRVYRLLQGYRNRPPADLEKLEEILIRLAQLATDVAEIEELDINPLLVSAAGFCAVDARVRLAPAQVPAPLHLVISAYPAQHEMRTTTRGLVNVFIRPIRPEDAPLLAALFESLSPRSIYQRFFSPLRHLPHGMLARFTQIDYDREIALVAFKDGAPQDAMLGVARIILQKGLKAGEFAVLVGDPWQGKGIGAELLKQCLSIAAERSVRHVYGMVLAENTQMLALGRKLGFSVRRIPESNTFELNVDVARLHEIRPGRPG